ncbi:MAG: heavy metal-binding domain-containing protein [Nitrospirota bacterium]|nr:heavy metal-binding domain-containing protein [Nitrospirota bacterium]
MTNLTIVCSLIVLGYIFGKLAENRHFRSIHERERKFLPLPTTSSKKPIGDVGLIIRAELVTGSVVISVDYFKRILAGLRNIVGGPLQPFETLLDRARREAILRLKETCPGATQVINLRIETSSISKGEGDSIGSVEVLAYGTALYCDGAQSSYGVQ